METGHFSLPRKFHKKLQIWREWRNKKMLQPSVQKQENKVIKCYNSQVSSSWREITEAYELAATFFFLLFWSVEEIETHKLKKLIHNMSESIKWLLQGLLFIGAVFIRAWGKMNKKNNN